MSTNNSWAICRKKNDGRIYTWNKYMNKQKWEKKNAEYTFHEKSGECAGFMKSAQNYECITVFVPIKELSYLKKKEDFQRWIDFINYIGFPCTFMGEAPKSLFGKRMYSVNIYPDLYPDSGRHLLACHTLIRYSYSYRYKKISEFTLKLLDKYEMNEWKCLYLAHYAEINNNSYRGYYGLISSKYIKEDRQFIYPPDEVGVYEWLCSKNVNQAFTNEIKTALPRKNGKHVPLTDDNMDFYVKKLKLC